MVMATLTGVNKTELLNLIDSFLIRRQAQLFNRRRSKINSTVVSIFTASYVFYWPTYFPDLPLKYPPSFDGRVVTYPTEKEVRDYFGWRQADSESGGSGPVQRWQSEYGMLIISTHQQPAEHEFLGVGQEWFDNDRGQ